MKPSISIITIGVDDLERAFAFYRTLFDIADEQIGAGEDHVAFFFPNDFSFVRFPRDQIIQRPPSRMAPPSDAAETRISTVHRPLVTQAANWASVL